VLLSVSNGSEITSLVLYHWIRGNGSVTCSDSFSMGQS